jgi:replicative DNA helicase
VPTILSHPEGEELFYAPANRRIWQAIANLHADRTEIDLITLTASLRASNALDEVGGPAMLAELMSDVPSPSGLPEYLRLSADDAKRRGIIRDCWRVADGAFDKKQKVASLIQELDNTTQRVFKTVATQRARRINQPLIAALDLIQERMQNGGAIPGLSYGIPELDEATNGMQPGEMIVVAARPGRGKTSLALTFGESLARTGTPILVFSAEMTSEKLAIRSLSGHSGIDSLRLAKGRIGQGELPKLNKAVAMLTDLPMWIDDRPAPRLIDIQIETRRLIKEHGIKLVIVDYLQLIREPEGSRSREDAVRQISAGLTQLAKELQIPVIVLAQLNRDSEKRAGNKPKASDLRESGSIEQDAHVILLLHSDEAADDQMIIDMEIIVAKCRDGKLGPVPVEFHRPTTTFKPKKAA